MLQTQEGCAHYNSLRTRDKHFSVGDRVIVLTPDYNNGRTYVHWIGPAIIAEVKSPQSYLDNMPDGSRWHFHANKLPPYITRVSNVGIISDSDCDFGDINTSPPDANRFSDHQKPIEKKSC